MPDVNSVTQESRIPQGDLQRAKKKQPVDRRGMPLPIRKSGYDALDKNSFLKLLVTQLAKQDPTNPMNDREFISQMAQFSSLEQMNNVANSMNKLRASQANQLIGKMVMGKDFVTEKPVQGIVTSSIYSPNGDVLLKVNGRHIKLDDISEVTEVTPIQHNLPNVSRETSTPQPIAVKPPAPTPHLAPVQAQSQAAQTYEMNQKAPAATASKAAIAGTVSAPTQNKKMIETKGE
jgi:flagellar basal-body rod modification protein FlgD